MGAQDSRHHGDGDGKPHLPPTSAAFHASIRALRDELEAHLVDPATDGHLGDLLDRVVTQGRAEGLRAEHLVIAFHEVWDGPHRVLPQGSPDDREQMRWRFVSSLITKYYSDSDG